MYTYRIVVDKYDSSRPFAVVCNDRVINPVKGRYATREAAQSRVRELAEKK